MYTVGDDGSGSQPDIIFDHYALSGDALVDEGTVRVIKNVVNRNDLCEGGGVNPVADAHAALPADHTVFADQAVMPDLNARVGHIPEIIHMQDSAVHDEGIGANLNALWTSMQVGALV